MNCSILESCVAIITKHKSSKGTHKLTVMDILLMSLKHVSNWLQYDVEIEAATGGTWHRFFPGNFAKFVITPFLQNTSGLLLLYNRSTGSILENNFSEYQR